MSEFVSSRDWQNVMQDLAGETLKVRVYDNALLEHLSDVDQADVLDYGSGPGVLAGRLQQMGADVKAYDIAPKMREACAAVIGDANVFNAREEIPEGQFDIVTCNLVVCINPAQEVEKICRTVRRALNINGRGLIGFCNPLIFDANETQLDYRSPTAAPYKRPHRINKIKKEGSYKIFDNHRPRQWYRGMFRKTGLTHARTHFTERYELGGKSIQDFIIYEVQRAR